MRLTWLLLACTENFSGVHVAVSASSSRPTSLCDDDGDWKLVWQDEFDTPSLNHTIWTVPVGVGSSFGRDANVTEADTYVENGMLVLRSQKLPGGKNYTTGAAITHHGSFPSTPGNKGISWQYGRFCVRAKLPGAGPGKSQGLWPAHWMMPADYSRHCGYNELDIMEMINGEGTAYGTYWYWVSSFQAHKLIQMYMHTDCYLVAHNTQCN
jgi:beta-glucanase (GH16 family)